MADTRPDILLPASTPVDIYAALNAQAGFPAVAAGAQLRVINKGNNDVYLYSSDTAPTISTSRDGVPIPKYGTGTNEVNDAGAFATSYIVDGLINVAVM